ncbi:hypothetical protein [Amycolatopsis sp. NPDC051372]|uniref:hypothetical protein n=1 Tax=Amycolatopsis sp. NPDC051372 TaxID=3155669 RepID=UPI00341CACAC
MRGGHRISLLLVLVFIGLYVGFQRSPRPYQVPVAVAGTQLQTQLAGAAGPAVAVVPVADQAAGEALLRHGDAVATLADQAGHLRLDVAGASGATTVSAAEKLVSAFAQHRGQPLVITDVLPLSAFDSKGMSGFYVAFGVTLASFALAQNLLAAARRVRLRHRMAALAGVRGAVRDRRGHAGRAGVGRAARAVRAARADPRPALGRHGTGDQGPGHVVRRDRHPDVDAAAAHRRQLDQRWRARGEPPAGAGAVGVGRAAPWCRGARAVGPRLLPRAPTCLCRSSRCWRGPRVPPS